MKGQDMEIGTLRELNVKPGDVVECVDGSIFASTRRKYTINEKCGIYGLSIEKVNLSTFRIVSRASDTPKLWKDMTDEEKGALLLAEHEGKVIEYGYFDEDYFQIKPNDGKWFGGYSYRVKPESVREVKTEKRWVSMHDSGGFSLLYSHADADADICGTCEITTLDGKPVSVKWEAGE